MRVRSQRPSRRRTAIFAAAALIALTVCLLVDSRFHPVGRMRTAVWGGGLVVYGILLHRAIGPAIDWRDGDDRGR